MYLNDYKVYFWKTNCQVAGRIYDASVLRQSHLFKKALLSPRKQKKEITLVVYLCSDIISILILASALPHMLYNISGM